MGTGAGQRSSGQPTHPQPGAGCCPTGEQIGGCFFSVCAVVVFLLCGFVSLFVFYPGVMV